MTRRLMGPLVILALGLLVAPLGAIAPPATMPRVGVLELGTPPPSPEWKARALLVQELRQLGWLEGQNIVFEYRWAQGQPGRLASLAAELVGLPVDVLVVSASPAIHAAQRATTTLPIVMVSVNDPVEDAIVADLARPGRNITGVGGLVPELSGKWLELLKDAVPMVTRVAVLANPENPATARMVHDVEGAAQALGVDTQLLRVRHGERFEPAFQAALRGGAGALLILPSVFFGSHQRDLAALALQHGLPAMFWTQGFAEAGGLMAYGPSRAHLWQRAATYVDKILKGAKPADLPVERPMRFELVVNLKTAKALGLTIAPSALFQADTVIR